MASADQLTGAQVRMARAFLRWSITDLARHAKVGISTVQAIESGHGVPAIVGGIESTREYRETARAESIERVRKALVGAGITFLPDDGKTGVGVRGRIKGGK